MDTTESEILSDLDKLDAALGNQNVTQILSDVDTLNVNHGKEEISDDDIYDEIGEIEAETEETQEQLEILPDAESITDRDALEALCSAGNILF